MHTICISRNTTKSQYPKIQSDYNKYLKRIYFDLRTIILFCKRNLAIHWLLFHYIIFCYCSGSSAFYIYYMFLFQTLIVNEIRYETKCDWYLLHLPCRMWMSMWHLPLNLCHNPLSNIENSLWAQFANLHSGVFSGILALMWLLAHIA